MISPDTQQNITVMSRLLLEHNFLAIVFLMGVIGSTLFALYKPSRGAICLMIGFALMLFAFQYEKHIADALIEQTTGSLITERQSGRIEWVIQKILGRAATPLFYLAGISSLCTGIFLLVQNRKK